MSPERLFAIAFMVLLFWVNLGMIFLAISEPLLGVPALTVLLPATYALVRLILRDLKDIDH